MPLEMIHGKMLKYKVRVWVLIYTKIVLKLLTIEFDSNNNNAN